MPPLWFCSLAARRAASRRGTAGTMGSQWHSRIRWRSQLRRHTSLAVTPLGWHLATHEQISVVIKLLENWAKQHPASPGCRRHWASMSERQIALEASPQIGCRCCWFLKTATYHFPRLRGLSKLGSTSRTIGVKWYQHTSDSFPSKSRTPFKNLCWYLILSISHEMFLIFLLDLSHRRPSHLHRHPSFVGSIGFLTTQETGATGGTANVQQCQRLPWTELGNSRVDLWSDKNHTEIDVQSTKTNLWLSNLHDTQIHRDVFS